MTDDFHELATKEFNRAQVLQARLDDVLAARIEIERQWQAQLDQAADDDDDGAHVGLARHSRAVAQGMGDALRILDAALAGES